jgi:hypothetical protein
MTATLGFNAAVVVSVQREANMTERMTAEMQVQGRGVDGRFLAGHAGNRNGQLRNKRLRELVERLAVRYGGLSALDPIDKERLVLAGRNIIDAERTKDPTERVRSTRIAEQVLSKIERNTKRRTDIPSLSELLKANA